MEYYRESYQNNENKNVWASLTDLVFILLIVLIILLTIFVEKTLNLSEDINTKLYQDVIAANVKNFVGAKYPKSSLEINALGNIQTIKFESDLLFPSGSYHLTPKNKEILAGIAGRINQYNSIINKIEVIGYADTVPVIPNNFYLDNLELSCERSMSVIRFLSKESSIPKMKLTAGCRSDFEGKEARVINRRVELRLIY